MDNQFGSGGSSSPTSSSNLIVNYLPQNLSDQEFHNLFAQIGAVKTCKIVRNKTNGYSYGFGFVDYEQPQDAQKAIDTYNGYQINGKTLKVAIAKPANSNHSKNTNVYIRGVPRSFDPSKLENMFAFYGRLVQFRVLRDPQSNENKGVAFALYDDKGNAERAIEDMGGKILVEGEEPLQVKIADDQMKIERHKSMASNNGHSRPGGPVYGRPMYGGGNFGGGAFGNSPSYRPNYRYNPMNKGPPNSYPMSHPSYGYGGGAPSHPPYPDYQAPLNESESTLFVYNIGFETDENSLFHLFSQYGNVEKVNVIVDKSTGKSKGYGFVTMSNYDEACWAIERLNNFLYAGKPLQVSFKTSGRSPQEGFVQDHPRMNDYPRRPGGGGGDYYHYMQRRYGGNSDADSALPPQRNYRGYDSHEPKRPFPPYPQNSYY